MELLKLLEQLVKRQDAIREKLRRRLRKYPKPRQQRILIATHEIDAAMIRNDIASVKRTITLIDGWPKDE